MVDTWIFIHLFGKLDILIYPEKDLNIGYFYYIKQVFFWRLRKTQGEKNSNSRKMDKKLKDFFPENSRNRKF
jgi:hypothetical protein